ncbi:MAG: efflux RND transporter periplasmic adaptor subunit [Candidatus Uhrbacteria bacterium]
MSIFRKKKWIVGAILILVIGGGYVAFKKVQGGSVAPRYLTAKAAKETLIVSVSGSGQVSASDQADVKPKVTGDVVWVGMKEGQEVRRGTALIRLDMRAAEKAVRDAQTGLETAELSLAKLKEPPDPLSLLQSEHALVQAQESKQQTEESIRKAHEDGFNATANAFLDFPAIMSGLQDVLLGSDRSFGTAGQWNIDAYADAVKAYDVRALQYRNDAYTKYQSARTAYDATFQAYKNTSRFADDTKIEALVRETYDVTRLMAEAVKSGNNLIQFYQDTLTSRSLKPLTIASTHLASLNAYTGKLNSHVSNLLSITRTIDDGAKSLVSADRTIAERTESLRKLKEGPDALDIRSQEITIQQRRDALADAEEKLSEYSIRAPFDGVIVKVNVGVGDAVSSGTAIATIVTRQKLAEVTLNEVDAAKVRVEQKVTLQFDAIPELTVSGEVASVDALGTVTQGVVTYATKINFDTQDERVKSGMSVSAAIITDAKQDTLVVPSAAIKQQGDASIVEVLVDGVPQARVVETGLTNDISTEITSGLQEGESVVTQTITAGTAAPTTGTSGLRAMGVPMGGGGGGSGGMRRAD